MINTQYRKPLPGTVLDYFDAREAVNAITPGAWDRLSYTARVHAENLVRRCDPAILGECLGQIVHGKRERDFPWFPARVVCHDILGQTALVDLAGLRDAIAKEGGDPAAVNPVVPVQLIVDHSLAVECGGFDPDAFAKNRAIEDRRNEDRFHGQRRRLPTSRSSRRATGSCTRSTWKRCRPWCTYKTAWLSPTPAWAPTATRRTSMRWA